MTELINLNKIHSQRFKFKSDVTNVNGMFRIFQDQLGFIWLLTGSVRTKLDKLKADQLILSDLRNYNDKLYKQVYL